MVRPLAVPLGAVLCVLNAASSPFSRTQSSPRRQTAQSRHGNPMGLVTAPPRLQRHHTSATISKQSEIPPPLPAEPLKLRRAAELHKVFAKKQVQPESDNAPLLPDKAAVPGMLHNGLTYVILPNQSPPQRFEAHLEIMAGAADEDDRQQGMAHLVEHMTFLGSPKRDPILGTGSSSNALTDFHQTVFHVDCPVLEPGSTSRPMLPYAMDLFRDILSSRFETTRFVKERAAVLSEMQMMNTIEYRLDCHILESLHAENRLAKRFPIGKEEHIQDWDLNEVRRFHRTHYRPTNAMLYIIGDVDTQQTEVLIKSIFDDLPSEHADYQVLMEKATEAQMRGSVSTLPGEGRVGSHVPPDEVGPLGERFEPTLKLQSMHFPPVLHRWVGGDLDNSYTVPSTKVDLASTVAGSVLRSSPDKLSDEEKASIATMMKTGVITDSIKDAMEKLKLVQPDATPDGPYNVKLFHHASLAAFSFHIFGKRPIEPVTDMVELRRGIAQTIAVAALRVRLGMAAKGQTEVQFEYMGFDMADCPREACNVGSLDLNCDGKAWRQAIALGVMEVRRLGLFGITEAEFVRYSKAMISDSAQVAALGAQGAIANTFLMERMKECVACGHTWMSAEDAHQACELAIGQVTRDDVNKEALELTKFIVDFGKGEGEPVPSAIVAGVPPPLDLTSEMVIDAIKEGAQRPVEPKPDVVMPTTLMSDSLAAEIQAEHPPAWADDRPEQDEFTKAMTRRLSNGMNITMMPLDNEPGRASLRILAPGGRVCEKGPGGCGVSPGAAAIGALTLQDGGRFEPFDREQIELFMVLNLVQWQYTCTEDSLVMDFTFGTKAVGDASISGLEAVLQFLNRVLTPGKYEWEEDSFLRAKQLLSQQGEQTMCSLEGGTTETLKQVVANNDLRLMALTREELEPITLEEAKEATMLMLNPGFLDVAIVGDLDYHETEKLVLQYFGTLPRSDAKREADGKALYNNDLRAPAPAPPVEGQGKHMRITIEDSQPRAVGYISGPSPNRWGILNDGRHIRDAVAELAPEGSYASVGERAAAAADSFEGGSPFTAQVAMQDRWSHPLFAPVVLSILQELTSNRLFMVVRDRKQLTYDVNFQFTQYERMAGGYWLTYVTATPDKVEQALDACHGALNELRSQGAAGLNLAPCRRTVLKQHEKEVHSNQYWAQLLAGVNSPEWPLKSISDLKDFYPLVDAVTAGDLMSLIKVIGIGEPGQAYSCSGVSGQDPSAAEEAGHSFPGQPGKRLSAQKISSSVVSLRCSALLGLLASFFGASVALHRRRRASTPAGKVHLLAA